jgi:hypothetical protein
MTPRNIDYAPQNKQMTPDEAIRKVEEMFVLFGSTTGGVKRFQDVLPALLEVAKAAHVYGDPDNWAGSADGLTVDWVGPTDDPTELARKTLSNLTRAVEEAT